MTKMICSKAQECNVYCFEKIPHYLKPYCDSNCDRKGGFPEARCKIVPLKGAELITDERRRQIEVEGWNTEHDDEQVDGQLSIAAVCYILDQSSYVSQFKPCELWPWDIKWWKPTPQDPIRQLVKAGALIAAEIDRLQRQKDKENG